MRCGFLLWAVGLALAASPAHARQQSHIILDYRTGAVLDARGADERAFPASLTKMMTLYLTFRALEARQITLDSRLKVSKRAARMPPTKLGLKAGRTLRVEDAILGLVTRSANDAAVVLAEALGGSEGRFALLMTKTARRLGMSRTVFKNASGLPDREQFSTARDLSRLAVRLIGDYPKYYGYFSRRSFTLAGREYGNHNRLMLSYDGMDGLKTGYTRASGFNLAASAVRDERRLVAVVLGGNTAKARDDRMAAILDDGFTKLERQRAAEPLVALAEPSPPKQEAAAALLVAASAAAPAVWAKSDAAAAKEEKEKEVVVASLDPTAGLAAAASTVTAPVPEPRIVPKSAVKKAAALRAKSTAAARKLARAKAEISAARAKQAAAAIAARKLPAVAAGQPFGIQVGAFQEAGTARAAAKQAVRYAPDLLRGTFVSVSSLSAGRKGLFRATLVGLDKDNAALACRLLKRQKQDCLVVQAAAAAPVAVAER